jgi:hypothetical protein
MTKKRKLVVEVGYFVPHGNKVKCVSHEELLAQPEQTVQEQEQEQEPVAWRYKTHNRYTYTEENYHELQGEPLYTSPQKREPMTDREISHGFRADKDATNAESYWAGVKLAEKAHGIGGEE